jgi:hypothetical protein
MGDDNRLFVDRTGLNMLNETVDPSETYPMESDVPDLGVGRINKFDLDCQSQIDTTFPITLAEMTR